jgi:hypothetical protein
MVLRPKDFVKYCVSVILPSVGIELEEAFEDVHQLRVMRKRSAAVDKKVKDVSEIYTVVDLRLQRHVVNHLLFRYNFLDVRGEEDPEEVFRLDRKKERKHLEQLDRNNGNPYRVIMDPLDGSSNFKNGDPNHGFLMKLLYNNYIVASIGYMPQKDSVIVSYGALSGGRTYAGSLQAIFDLPEHTIFHFSDRSGRYIVGSGTFIDDDSDSLAAGSDSDSSASPDNSDKTKIMINTKAYQQRKFADFKRRLTKADFLYECPFNTLTMYTELFKGNIGGLVSLDTTPHDHALVHAVVKAGGTALVFYNGNYIPAFDLDWRKVTEEREGKLVSVIAASEKDLATELARHAKRYASSVPVR